MAYLASRPLLLALAFASSLSVPACFLVGGSCNCPLGGGGSHVTVPAAQSSPIARVSTNAPCTASANGDDTVVVYTPTAGSCQVLVELANGDTYTFSVQFVPETVHGDCDCGVLRMVGGPPVPTITDAGING